MIAHLKGKVLKRTDRGVILSTGDVGYFVNLPIISEDKELELFIHSHIREDAFDLYGFKKYEEMEFFKKLISINGIGPRLAMDILKVPIDQMSNAILGEDIDFIRKIPGIGPKSAKRIILELKGTIATRDFKGLEINNDVSEALQQLGYSKQHIMKGLEKLPKDLVKPEQIISYFLKNS